MLPERSVDVVNGPKYHDELHKLSAAQNPCIQPLYLGEGHSFLQRWYYNAQLNMCQQFIYTGSKGNQNNFQTQEQCQVACIGI